MPFDGATYKRDKDGKRLWTQLTAVDALLKHASSLGWLTLESIKRQLTCSPYSLNASEASISARLRDLRKAKFGGYVVERKRLSGGLWAYRIKPSFELEMQ
tara:strand:+ start:651 stop:953 length:303 start_codon:yes stop_codon:yes gene_type:complete